MPITQQDIADKVGVSRRLVSYALNGGSRINADTQARILALASEMGYKPNRAAQSLMTGRTYQIALCLPTLSGSFHTQFIHHFEALLRHSPYELLIATTLDQARAMPQVDGILIHNPTPPKDTSRPTVLLQSPPGYAMPADNKTVDQVFFDLAKATEDLMNHLLKLGKPRIAYVASIAIMTPDETRLQAYNAAMKRAQLPPEIITIDYRSYADMRPLAHRTLEEYFVKHGFPDVLFCSNDEVAIGAYRALRNAGRKIPEDTALAGCDNIGETADMVPSLTTITHAWDDACRCAWDLLVERIRNPDAAPQQRSFSSELIIRDSSVISKI